MTDKLLQLSENNPAFALMHCLSTHDCVLNGWCDSIKEAPTGYVYCVLYFIVNK